MQYQRFQEDGSAPRAPITGVLIPVVNRCAPEEVVKIADVVAVFKGWHALEGHIEADWTTTLPIRPKGIYVLTRYGAVFDLRKESFRKVAHRFPPLTFWAAFSTLLVDIEKVKRLDRNDGSRLLKRPALVKRVGFVVDPDGFDEGRVEWVTLSREARPRVTAYFEGRLDEQ